MFSIHSESLCLEKVFFLNMWRPDISFMFHLPTCMWIRGSGDFLLVVQVEYLDITFCCRKCKWFSAFVREAMTTSSPFTRFHLLVEDRYTRINRAFQTVYITTSVLFLLVLQLYHKAGSTESSWKRDKCLKINVRLFLIVPLFLVWTGIRDIVDFILWKI